MKRFPAIFLDRDGVLNEAVIKDGKPHPPLDVASMTILVDTSEVLKSLKTAGFILICVTNQPDVRRGKQTLANIMAMNQKIRDNLPLDDLFVCYHDNKDDCLCRKPKPGMLFMAAQKWHIDLAKSWMVGDRASDVAAGHSAGCHTIFLDFDYAEPKPSPEADFTVGSLPEAVAIITRASTMTLKPEF
jgi:D-glycero-D-manno-heptose 1,7-bisphosphate phosphatase